jgi:hypothetical protein
VDVEKTDREDERDERDRAERTNLDPFHLKGSSSSSSFRYNDQLEALGVFESSQTRIMQLWGDTDNSGHYYTANWDHGTITKRGPFPKTDLVWTFDLGGVAAGVTGDDAAVYAMRHDDAVVHVLDKDSGLKLREVTLTGGQTGSLYGGLACVAGSVGSKLYYGARTTVHRHDLTTGASDASFDTTVAGRILCITYFSLYSVYIQSIFSLYSV